MSKRKKGNQCPCFICPLSSDVNGKRYLSSLVRKEDVSPAFILPLLKSVGDRRLANRFLGYYLALLPLSSMVLGTEMRQAKGRACRVAFII